MRGFGTKFHQVYSDDADLYHAFSSAEVFSNDLLLEIRRLIRGETLLDVACGTCQKTNQISNYFGRVYALDISSKLLEKGRDTYRCNKKLVFLKADAAKIPLLNESVDTIFISWGSFPLSKTLLEMRRVLRPGGIIIRIGIFGRDEFTNLFPKFNLQRLKRIRSKFINEGFSSKRFEVNIKFRDLKTAQNILSKIIGTEKKNINKRSYTHDIYLYTFIKK